MIVRDEALRLATALASIRPWVDEMIVVDTGSTDGTVEIAKQCGAAVHFFPWCDDFSAARNASLRHARGRWLFWMDADDTIDETNGRNLKELASREAEPGILGYVMKVSFPGPGPERSTDVTVVDHVKMFRNLPELRFEGRIHEQILPAIRRLGGDVKWTDVVIDHSGYDYSPEGQAKKRARDLHLLELESAERPNHPFVLFNLGMTYCHMGQDDRAIEALKQCVIVSTPAESHTRKAYALLSAIFFRQRQVEVAWSVCQTGRRLFPEDAELLFREGELLRHVGHLGDAERAYRQLLDGERPAYLSSFDQGILGFRTRHNLAAVYARQGKLDVAEAEWHKAINEAPGFAPAWAGLLDLLDRQGRHQVARELTERMLKMPELRSLARSWRARLASREGDFKSARAELETAVQEQPADVAAIEELCRFLFDHGPLDHAEAQLRCFVELRPESAAAHHNLGTVCLRQGRTDAAIQSFREALRLRPESAQTHLYLGDALQRAGRLAEAISAWKDAARLSEDDTTRDDARERVERHK
jgi:tetratricopeptide (TPR) repeat protein